MLTAEIGPEYKVHPLSLLRDCKRPVRAVQDHGLDAIIAACDDESQSDRALEATMRLYPPLVCRAEGLKGSVIIPVMHN